MSKLNRSNERLKMSDLGFLCMCLLCCVSFTNGDAALEKPEKEISEEIDSGSSELIDSNSVVMPESKKPTKLWAALVDDVVLVHLPKDATSKGLSRHLEVDLKENEKLKKAEFRQFLNKFVEFKSRRLGEQEQSSTSQDGHTLTSTLPSYTRSGISSYQTEPTYRDISLNTGNFYQTQPTYRDTPLRAGNAAFGNTRYIETPPIGYISTDSVANVVAPIPRYYTPQQDPSMSAINYPSYDSSAWWGPPPNQRNPIHNHNNYLVPPSTWDNYQIDECSDPSWYQTGQQRPPVGFVPGSTYQNVKQLIPKTPPALQYYTPTIHYTSISPQYIDYYTIPRQQGLNIFRTVPSSTTHVAPTIFSQNMPIQRHHTESHAIPTQHIVSGVDNSILRKSGESNTQPDVSIQEVLTRNGEQQQTDQNDSSEQESSINTPDSHFQTTTSQTGSANIELQTHTIPDSIHKHETTWTTTTTVPVDTSEESRHIKQEQRSFDGDDDSKLQSVESTTITNLHTTQNLVESTVTLEPDVTTVSKQSHHVVHQLPEETKGTEFYPIEIDHTLPPPPDNIAGFTTTVNEVSTVSNNTQDGSSNRNVEQQLDFESGSPSFSSSASDSDSIQSSDSYSSQQSADTKLHETPDQVTEKPQIPSPPASVERNLDPPDGKPEDLVPSSDNIEYNILPADASFENVDVSSSEDFSKSYSFENTMTVPDSIDVSQLSLPGSTETSASVHYGMPFSVGEKETTITSQTASSALNPKLPDRVDKYIGKYVKPYPLETSTTTSYTIADNVDISPIYQSKDVQLNIPPKLVPYSGAGASKFSIQKSTTHQYPSESTTVTMPGSVTVNKQEIQTEKSQKVFPEEEAYITSTSKKEIKFKEPKLVSIEHNVHDKHNQEEIHRPGSVSSHTSTINLNEKDPGLVLTVKKPGVVTIQHKKTTHHGGNKVTSQSTPELTGRKETWWSSTPGTKPILIDGGKGLTGNREETWWSSTPGSKPILIDDSSGLTEQKEETWWSSTPGTKPILIDKKKGLTGKKEETWWSSTPGSKPILINEQEGLTGTKGQTWWSSSSGSKPIQIDGEKGLTGNKEETWWSSTPGSKPFLIDERTGLTGIKAEPYWPTISGSKPIQIDERTGITNQNEETWWSSTPGTKPILIGGGKETQTSTTMNKVPATLHGAKWWGKHKGSPPELAKLAGRSSSTTKVLSPTLKGTFSKSESHGPFNVEHQAKLFQTYGSQSRIPSKEWQSMQYETLGGVPIGLALYHYPYNETFYPVKTMTVAIKETLNEVLNKKLNDADIVISKEGKPVPILGFKTNVRKGIGGTTVVKFSPSGEEFIIQDRKMFFCHGKISDESGECKGVLEPFEIDQIAANCYVNDFPRAYGYACLSDTPEPIYMTYRRNQIVCETDSKNSQMMIYENVNKICANIATSAVYKYYTHGLVKPEFNCEGDNPAICTLNQNLVLSPNSEEELNQIK